MASPFRLRGLLALGGFPSALFVSVALAGCGSERPSPRPTSEAASAVGGELPTKPLSGAVDLDTTWELVAAPERLVHHASVTLNSRTVLITGGYIEDPTETEPPMTTEAAYLFDTKSKTFSPVPMNDARHGHTATKLLDGRVLVALGEMADYGYSTAGWKPLSFYPVGMPVYTAELFDPATSKWTKHPQQLTAATVFGTALLLQSGTVLITGGQFDGPTPLALGFDPQADDAYAFGDYVWLDQGRAGHSLSQVWDGTILVMGGETYDGYSSRDVLSLSSDYWQQEEYSLQNEHAYHTATMLDDEKILLAGGQNSDGMPWSGVDLYEWGEGASAIMNMHFDRVHHSAAKLPDGRVLVAGGYGFDGALASTEIFDPSTNSWSLGPELNEARYGHTMEVVGGKLIVIGGMNRYEEGLANIEVLTFSEEEEPSGCSTDAECPDGSCVDGVCVSAPKQDCEGMQDGAICGEYDGCAIGICRNHVCEAAHKLDGSPCEGGVCVAGECKLDRSAIPGDADFGPGGGQAGSGEPGDGPGPGQASSDGGEQDEDSGGLCSASPGAPRHLPMAIAMAFLAGLGAWRRRAKVSETASARG